VVEVGSEPKSKPKSYRNLIIGVIVVAAILVVLLFPLIPTSEAYNVTEPFERKCTYVVDDWDLEEQWSLSLGFYVQSDVTVRNTDEAGGTFTVLHRLEDIHGLFGTDTDSFYLNAGGSHTSTAIFDTSMGQDTKGTYSVTAPFIPDVRIVTKHRTVYKSIIELLVYG
jgi:hypothetical protein